MTGERVITSAEVAELLGCSPRTVQRMAERGDLPYETKLRGTTGSYLFSRQVVEMYLSTRAAS